ncbi:hypothetical protein BLOHGJAL_00405 [Klebsiella phage 066039]|nr:hypothetical protein BLOHGJAL_00405 [Klebsiella phage 066039]
MKLGLTYNGQEYNSGMALQLTAQGNNVVSQVLFIADRFAIIRNAASGAYTLPFVVQNDQVFMNNALIQDGSITNAKIGQYIQSNNFISGQQGWSINKSGASEFNNVVVRGALFAASGNFGFDGGNGVVINGNGVTVNLDGGGRIVLGRF